MITAEELHQIMPNVGRNAEIYVGPLNAAMREFYIDNALREAAFLAQVAHESGELHYVAELSSGEQYEGRADLGNTEPGDGARYKGRGFLQTTGRRNYALCSVALGIDCLEHPELLETPKNAARSSGLFWSQHGLNTLSDQENFVLITKRINGGLNGFDKRFAFYQKAKQVLGATG